MPLPLPSSFASAAAGINQDSKKDGTMSGEWTRSRTNGATQTFRRPSVATNLSHNRDSSSQPTSTPTSTAYIPPHMTSNYQPRNGSTGDSRYSKEDLLSIFKGQRDSGALGKNMGDHFLASWNPLEDAGATNGAWAKKEDQKDSPPGPEVCWDHLGHYEPLGLIEMTEEERELFSTTVNSPLKPPPSSATKDNTPGVGGRKASVSHSTSFNTSSPSSGRPGTRRRETQDSTGNPMSPTAGSRFFREEPNTTTPPPSLLRRKTDLRDPASSAKQFEEKDKPKDLPEISSPFGSLKRSATNPVVSGLASTSSPWTSASQTANLSPMGAFGSFSLGTSSPQAPTSAVEKRPGFGSVRGESRFKGLLSKDSSEDVGMLAKDKGLAKEIERLAETEGTSRSQSPWNETVKTRATRSETNPFDEPRSGSAALGGSEEVGSGIDELGFAAFGMTAGVPGLRDLLGRGDGAHGSPSHLQGLEPTSPTNTNPYQSPRGEKVDDDVDTDGSDVQRSQHPGISGLRDDAAAAPFSSIRRGGSALDMSAGDRSQTSSVGPGRGFSNLSGLTGLPAIGGSGAWPSAGAIGTPTRERAAFTGFGDPIFGSMAEVQSPGLSTLGAGGFFGSHAGLSGTGSIGRASKMGSLFPPSMQDNTQGEIGRQEDGSRSQDLKPSTSTPSQLPTTSAGSALTTPLATSSEVSQTQQGLSTGGSNALPTAQQRTMVMPDRMRWIYRDPQGNIQGPWSGLEMHDWFKAGFFTAELQVKKLEDPEFEPLAQLVRRIGNSREPFLVPQIGIPHGPEPNQAATWGTGTQPGAAQPPFANSFPTFGTTLTAEQQNALERRKQEEQYLMARQKEHLAQQQAMMKQMQLQGGPHSVQPQLQHHSSAHSLQSQPSFGSITSPAGGYQQSPIQGPIQPPQPMPGYFDGPFRQNTLPFGPQILGTDFGSHEELPGFLDRLNLNRPGPFPLNSQGSFSGRQQEASIHPQQVNSILQERARLQQEQEQYDKTHSDSIFEQQARDERLRQFHALRSDEDENLLRGSEGLGSLPTSTAQQNESDQEQQEEEATFLQDQETSTNEPLSLSQQVQKAATAQRQQQQQQKQVQAEAAWVAKGDPGIPHPFPPPPSQSPLPAPAAQRNRQHVADALAATSRSQNQTPVETPSASIAPWAKDSIEAPKGPSLKEIQEAEARSAAQREELAAQARRAQLLAEQERLSQAQQATAPGLPSTANWASSVSPVTPSTASSAWSKPAAKATGTPAKTLAQIQKEEEARKQKLAQVSAVQAAATTAASPVSGKRYADLASKVAASPTPAATGAWTTVGAGGKAKAPPATPVGPRSTSATLASPQVAKPRPVAPVRTTTIATTPVSNANRANEEFTKWAKVTLGKGLNNGINVDDFVQQLLFLPAEAEIISDSVYANSQTLDGRRFAEEFIRRRKLADKGIADPVSTNAFIDQKAASGGWSEVAKKSSSQPKQEDESAAAFKVVAGKKKGKR